jgi:hypothetical protein
MPGAPHHHDEMWQSSEVRALTQFDRTQIRLRHNASISCAGWNKENGQIAVRGLPVQGLGLAGLDARPVQLALKIETGERHRPPAHQKLSSRLPGTV